MSIRLTLLLFVLVLALSRCNVFYPNVYSPDKLSRTTAVKKSPLFLRLALPVIPGAKWQVLGMNRLFMSRVDKTKYGTLIPQPNHKLLGSAGWSQFIFSPIRAGTSSIRFALTSNIAPASFHTIMVTAK